MPAKATKIVSSGDAELKHLLEELPKRVIKKGLRAAITKAGQIVAKAARARAPKQTGLLRQAITKKIKFYAQTGSVVAIVGADRSVVGADALGKRKVPANYIHLVEKGTAPHDEPNNRWIPHHPGTEGTHFLERAYEAERGNAVNAAAGKLTEVLETEAAKLAKT